MTFYTDGSCIGNGKANATGGYGVVGVDETTDKVAFVRAKRSNDTTNNREELKAILYVMLNYGEKCDDWGQPPIVYSDSAYCVNTFNEWMFSWARKGWIKSDKKPALNPDLWEILLDLTMKHTLHYHWVKGHAENPYNNRCDEMAVAQAQNAKCKMKNEE